MNNVLVFGGAFNPPTNAHINLAYLACHKIQADGVVFVPSKMSYIKEEQRKDFAFSDGVRLNMLQKIAEKKSWMKVSDFELLSIKQPRTYDTLCYLKEKGYQCKLLFGSDKLWELETGWKHVTEIANEFGFVCMTRNHDDCEKKIEEDLFLRNIKNKIELVHTSEDYQDISSTKVRKLFLHQQFAEIDKLVPAELNGLREYTERQDLR